MVDQSLAQVPVNSQVAQAIGSDRRRRIETAGDQIPHEVDDVSVGQRLAVMFNPHQRASQIVFRVGSP
jgi:hypothetical protein